MPEIKVYLYSDPTTYKEIRRFNLLPNDYQTYSTFHQLIYRVFPSLVNQQFDIIWKDEAHDRVTMRNDEEFQFMKMKHQGLNCIQIIIFPKFNEKPELHVEPIVHPGVVCDACDSEILGHRYKCIQCPDYDLCMQCEIQGMHQEHCVVRLAKPMTLNLDYAKRLAHHFNKFANISQSECPFSGGRRKQRKCKQSETMENPSASVPLPLDIDKMINQTLPQMLKCWGIDMNFLQNPVPANKETPIPTNQEKPAAADQENSVPANQEKPVPADQEKPVPIVQEKTVHTDQEKLVTIDEGTPSTSKESSPAPKEYKEKSVGEGWTILNSFISPPPLSSNQTHAIPVPVQGEDALKPIYPTLPQENKIFHPDPKIQRSVEAMMAMGFSNEGGWLTHLLSSKNGDISKVLDILQPVRR